MCTHYKALLLFATLEITIHQIGFTIFCNSLKKEEIKIATVLPKKLPCLEGSWTYTLICSRYRFFFSNVEQLKLSFGGT